MGRNKTKVTEDQLVTIGLNPFISSRFSIIKKTFTEKNSFEAEDSGELLPKVYNVDRWKHVKLSTDKEARKCIALLRGPAASCLLWIMQELEEGKDYVCINWQRYQTEHGHKSDRMLRHALQDLTRYEFIRPTKVLTVYWINPVLMFKGSRLAKYPDKVTSE